MTRPSPTIDLVAEHLACATMGGKAALWLERNGVSAADRHRTAAGWPSPMLCADIVFDGRRFEFARHRLSNDAVPAFVFPVYDQYGDNTDLAAWHPTEGVGLWLNNVAMLGEEQLDRSLRDEPLQVHASVLAWLRGNRHGVVVVDQRRAIPMLRDVGPLVVNDIELGEQLKRKLTLRAPKILVRAIEAGRAAA